MPRCSPFLPFDGNFCDDPPRMASHRFGSSAPRSVGGIVREHVLHLSESAQAEDMRLCSGIERRTPWRRRNCSGAILQTLARLPLQGQISRSTVPSATAKLFAC